MAQEETKKRIMDEALRLFARHGYEAVSVAQIAAAVGIKAPSLYKHYKSKRDIFEAIVREMGAQYEQQAGAMQMHGRDGGADAALFAGLGEEQLVTMGKTLFGYFLHDEYTCLFRRMLVLEQYQNTELAALFAQQYVDAPLEYQGLVFALFGQQGVLQAQNPRVMALHFYAPLYLLLTLCDSQPQREGEAMEMLEEHIRQFCRMYQ